MGSGGREYARVWKLMMALVWLSVPLTAALNSPAVETNVTDILTGLRTEHPRLLLTRADFSSVRAASATNSETAALLARAEAAARVALAKPPLTYAKQGKRLLAVSREALRRIALWSFAHRLTGEKVFAERAEQELLNLAAFKDWNPSHFLDTAEMTAALAIGYDWLFDALPASSRATVRQAIVVVIGYLAARGCSRNSKRPPE